MRRLILERLKVHARVGILEHELAAPQELTLTITVELPNVPVVPPADDILRVFDYRHLRDVALKETDSGHIHLLETLAGRIAQQLLAYPPVARVIVRVDKPHIFDDCDAIGVEVDVRKQQ